MSSRSSIRSRSKEYSTISDTISDTLNAFESFNQFHSLISSPSLAVELITHSPRLPLAILTPEREAVEASDLFLTRTNAVELIMPEQIVLMYTSAHSDEVVSLVPAFQIVHTIRNVRESLVEGRAERLRESLALGIKGNGRVEGVQGHLGPLARVQSLSRTKAWV